VDRDRDLVNDGGLDLWRYGRGFTAPFGPSGAPITHVQPPSAPPKVLPDEARDIRFDSAEEACGCRPFTAADARVEAESA
jgi:hypothetical protein